MVPAPAHASCLLPLLPAPASCSCFLLLLMLPAPAPAVEQSTAQASGKIRGTTRLNYRCPLLKLFVFPER